MMKLCTNILEVMISIDLKDGPRTRQIVNWNLHIAHAQSACNTTYSVNVYAQIVPFPVEYLDICATAVYF